jgi:hypothetical protein
METQKPYPEPKDPLFGPVIYAYTRAQALADGVLVDVTEAAKEVGFKLQVAITEMLHNRLTPAKADEAIGQNYADRLWDVLWLAAFTIKLADRGTDAVAFTVSQQEVEAKNGQPQNVDLPLWAVCGPGDKCEPVVTIGFLEDF